jgi:hypothetical protein
MRHIPRDYVEVELESEFVRELALVVRGDEVAAPSY